MTSPSSGGAGRKGLRPALTLLLGAAVAALLLALTALTCIDVVARYWFNAPVDGAFEVTQLLVAALVFAALPLTTDRGEHVEVDLFAHVLGPRIGGALLGLGGLVAAVVLAVFAWRLYVHAAQLAVDGSVTDALQVPLAPLGYFAAAACALSAVIAALRGFQRGR